LSFPLNKYIAIILLVFSGTAFADISGKVVAVTDGDTIKVLDSNNVQYKVHLTGIDAPEKTQPFGNALATCKCRVTFRCNLTPGVAIQLEPGNGWSVGIWLIRIISGRLPYDIGL